MKAPQLVRFHPHTGAVLEPVYVTKRGRVVWPILGASDDDSLPPGMEGDSDSEDSTDDDSDSDSDEDDSDDSDDKKSKSKKKDEDDDEDATVPQWKYDKVLKRMQAADQRSSRLEKELAELKKAGVDSKNVDAKLKEENERLTPQVEKLSKTNAELRLQIAFLSANEIDWVDPQAALKLADLSEVDIDEETGKVDSRALKAALKELARSKKYLVRSATKDEGDSDDSGASGGKMNGKRKGDRGTPDRAALAKRFPALGAR